MKILVKSRIDNIKNLNLKKYLFYTIGEIIIIVLGIFIALQFDELSLKNKNEKYITGVLEKIKGESENYISNSIYFLSINAKRDSAAYKILSNNLTIHDYIEDDKYYMNQVIQTGFNRNLLNDLNKQLDYLNESDKKIYKQLQIIETNDIAFSTLIENSFEIVSEHKLYQKRNHDWFYSIHIDSTAKHKDYNYKLNSYRYKNYVKDFKNYEINFKSSRLSKIQCLSAKLLISTINNLKDEKLNAKQIDSVLLATKLLKFKKLSSNPIQELAKKEYNMFDNTLIYHFFYNSTKDTINIKKQNESTNLISLAPKEYKIKGLSNNTELNVYVNESFKAKYVTELNSYLFYE